MTYKREKSMRAVGLAFCLALALSLALGCSSNGELVNEAPTDEGTPSSEILPAPSATETTEARNEGVLDIGSWRIAISDWSEAQCQLVQNPFGSGQVQQCEEGWKYIHIKAFIANTSGRVVYANELTDCCPDGSAFWLEADGFQYRSAILGYLSTAANSVVPGLPLPIELETRVPQNKVGFILKAGLNPAEGIRQGDVAADARQASGSVQLLGQNEAWVIPRYADIRLDGILTVDATTAFNGQFQEQYASFSITNDYGDQIYTRTDTEMELLVILANGTAASGDPYGYTRQIPADAIDRTDIGPGVTATKAIHFADSSLVSEGIGGLVDTSGAIVVLFYDDDESSQLVGKLWAAWQLP